MEVASRLIELEWKLVFVSVRQRLVVVQLRTRPCHGNRSVKYFFWRYKFYFFLYVLFIFALYTRDCNIRKIMLVTWLYMVVL